jgi:hypothetical protein
LVSLVRNSSSGHGLSGSTGARLASDDDDGAVGPHLVAGDLDLGLACLLSHTDERRPSRLARGLGRRAQAINRRCLRRAALTLGGLTLPELTRAGIALALQVR